MCPKLTQQDLVLHFHLAASFTSYLVSFFPKAGVRPSCGLQQSTSSSQPASSKTQRRSLKAEKQGGSWRQLVAQAEKVALQAAYSAASL